MARDAEKAKAASGARPPRDAGEDRRDDLFLQQSKPRPGRAQHPNAAGSRLRPSRACGPDDFAIFWRGSGQISPPPGVAPETDWRSPRAKGLLRLAGINSLRS